MANNQDRRALLRYAEGLGYTVTKTLGGHLRFQLPNQQPIYASYSPSDWRGWVKARVQLRRTAEEATRAR